MFNEVLGVQLDQHLVSIVLAGVTTAAVTWRFRPQDDPRPWLSRLFVVGWLASALWVGILAWAGKTADDARDRGTKEFQTFVRKSLENGGPEGEACLKVAEPKEQRVCAELLFAPPSPEVSKRMNAWLRKGQGALADAPERGSDLVDGVLTGPRHAHLGGPASTEFASPFDCSGDAGTAERHCQTKDTFTYWIQDRQETGRLFLSLVDR